MKTVQEELAEICAEHDGLLRAEDIVEYARNPETALHSRFTWDDNKAAEAHRLWQARQVIRVHVQVFSEAKEPVRMYVNLVPDRRNEGGGYRPIVDVMANRDMRAQLLKQAMAEVNAWRAKYRALKELEPIFDAINQVNPPVIAPTVSQTVNAAAD